MNELTFRCTGAPLPPFCAKCGLVEEHEAHRSPRGYWWEFASDKISAHKFVKPPRTTHDPRCTSLQGGYWGCNCWSYEGAPDGR